MRCFSFVLWWVILASVSLGLRSQPFRQWGPIYHEFEGTPEGGVRVEAVGPFFYSLENEEEEGWTVVPFVSFRENPAAERTEFDFVYPFLTYDRFGADYRVQFLQLFSLSGGQGATENQSRRFTLFPFLFYQHSPDPKGNYFAFIPFYGHLEGRLLRDEIDFVMLPGYLKSRKRDVVTRNYLFPIFHLRSGLGLQGWQVWPLVGRESKRVTTSTNGFGDIEIVPGHERLFVGWPIFFNNTLGIGTENPQRQVLVLPFFSRQTSPLRDSTTILWPFGLTYTDDRERKYREWGAPWPLVTFANGPGKTARRIWPLFGRARNATLQSDFYFWPIYKFNRATSEPLDRRRTRILFFLYSGVREKNTQTGTELRRTDVWPLLTAQRDHSGNERVQWLALLEPLVPHSKSIERNYSPLWSVLRSEKHGKTGVSSQSLLWNLYRQDRTEDTRKCSLLFGLFQYQSGPQGKEMRLFYLPVGKFRKPS